jgi:hypothetical protein
VEPEPLLARHRRQRAQVVDGAAVGGPRGGDDAGGLEAGRPVRGDGRAQRGGVQAATLVRGHPHQRPVAQAQQLDRLLAGAVHLVGGVEAQGPGNPRDPLLAHVDAGHDVARHGEAQDVGLGAAVAERRAGASGKPIISHIQRVTCPSISAAPWLPPPRFDPSTAARKSPSAPVKVPAPMYHIQKRGWVLPMA